jgi:outer membrane protein OmpA-like peptidoglycan-associated protein
MQPQQPVRIVLLAIILAIPLVLPLLWIAQAKARLEVELAAAVPERKVAVARAADADYCSPELKRVLRRVLRSCGLISEDGTRGCQPMAAKNVASLSGSDFNALFAPMRERGGIVQFEAEKTELDATDNRLIADVFSDQRGASYFFVVARASKTGTPKFNRALSHKRSNSVKFYVEDAHGEKELDKLMGTLWLGFDYAQLGKEYCEWNVSRGGQRCTEEAINRSAFVSWVDCRL